MDNNEKRISELAYQIWESEGQPSGEDKRHWYTACNLTATESSSLVREAEKETLENPQVVGTDSDKALREAIKSETNNKI